MIKTTDLMAILLEASEIIEGFFKAETRVNFKEDKSPVTVADLAANAYLKSSLLKLLPGAGWLSEEEKDNSERLTKEFVWIVDPLDGTKEFVARIPEIAISVALVRENITVLGAVINPITKEGAICSSWEANHFFGIKQQISSAELSTAKTIVSRTEFNNGKIKPFENNLKNIKAVGSVAYKLLRVAAGADDFYFSVEPKSEWDVCGGIALLNSTGKIYRRFDDRENLFNQENTKISSGAAAGSAELVEDFFNSFELTI